MIEAESLAVLNNLTEHFQDAFKKVAEALWTAHTHGGGLFRGWCWEIGPNLVFDHMETPVSEIMVRSL
jgi:hypothetical protein